MEMGGWYRGRMKCEGRSTQEQLAVHMCDFDGIRKGNYFGGQSIGRTEVDESGQAQEWEGRR